VDRKPNKKRKIPFQARRLVREVLSGKHKTLKSASEAAGYNGTDGYRALRNLQGSISEILDQAGMTDSFLAQNCLRPLLDATQTKLAQHEGKFTDAREVADNDARIRTLDMVWRLKGKYAPLAVEQAHKHAVKVIILDAPRPKRDHPPPTVIEIAHRAGAGRITGQAAERVTRGVKCITFAKRTTTQGQRKRMNWYKSDGICQTAPKKHEQGPIRIRSRQSRAPARRQNQKSCPAKSWKPRRTCQSQLGDTLSFNRVSTDGGSRSDIPRHQVRSL
jgi:hypothetical protein